MDSNLTHLKIQYLRETSNLRVATAHTLVASKCHAKRVLDTECDRLSHFTQVAQMASETSHNASSDKPHSR